MISILRRVARALHVEPHSSAEAELAKASALLDRVLGGEPSAPLGERISLLARQRDRVMHGQYADARALSESHMRYLDASAQVTAIRELLAEIDPPTCTTHKSRAGGQVAAEPGCAACDAWTESRPRVAAIGSWLPQLRAAAGLN